MRVFVVTPPEPVISLADAKNHLNVSHDLDDALIEAIVASATGHLDGPDGWLGRAIGEQTLEARFSVFECAAPTLRLPYPPLISVEAVTYLDASRLVKTVDADDYDILGSVLVPVAGLPWEGCLIGREVVRVRYVAGSRIVPPAIRAAILLLVGDLYRYRETAAVGFTADAIPMSASVENLLAPMRVFS